MIDVRRKIDEPAGAELLGATLVELVADRETELARNDRHGLAMWVLVRRNPVACGHLQANREGAGLSGVARKDGHLTALGQDGGNRNPLDRLDRNCLSILLA